MKFVSRYKADRGIKTYTVEYIEALYETIKSGKIPKDKYFVDRKTLPAIKQAIQLRVLDKETFVRNCLNAQKVGNEEK